MKRNYKYKGKLSSHYFKISVKGFFCFVLVFLFVFSFIIKLPILKSFGIEQSPINKPNLQIDQISYSLLNVSKYTIDNKTKTLTFSVLATNNTNNSQNANINAFVSSAKLQTLNNIDSWLNDLNSKRLIYSKTTNMAPNANKKIKIKIGTNALGLNNKGVFGIDICGQKTFINNISTINNVSTQNKNIKNEKKYINAFYLATDAADSIIVLKKYKNLNIIFDPYLLLNFTFLKFFKAYIYNNPKKKYFSLPINNFDLSLLTNNTSLNNIRPNYLLDKKIKNKIDFYNRAQTVSKNIIKKYLPKEYLSIDNNVFIGTPTDNILPFIKTDTDIFDISSVNSLNLNRCMFQNSTTKYNGYCAYGLVDKTKNLILQNGITLAETTLINDINKSNNMIFNNSNQLSIIKKSKVFSCKSKNLKYSDKKIFTPSSGQINTQTKLLSKETLPTENNIELMLKEYKQIKNFSAIFEDSDSFFYKNVYNVFSPFSKYSVLSIKNATKKINNLLCGISINSLKQIQIISSDTKIPISINNSFSEPINIKVKIVPKSFSVSSKKTLSLKVGPTASSTAKINLHINNNYNTKVKILILNPYSKVIKSKDQLLLVNSHSELYGLFFFGFFLLFLIIIGILRYLYLKKTNRLGRLGKGFEG